MTNYESFCFIVGHLVFILFAIAAIGIGGVLTIVAIGICLVAYYPAKLYDVTRVWVDSKIFKKGNK